MVSNASDDLPEPDRPVKTISLSRGSSRSTLRRLCSRAPRMVIESATVPPSYRLGGQIERMFDQPSRGFKHTIVVTSSDHDGAHEVNPRNRVCPPTGVRS